MKFEHAYMVGWCLAMLMAGGILSQKFRAGSRPDAYFRFLLRPWKTLTFGIAFVGMVVIAPYTGDHTWDYIDAAVMAILTFLTAPWSVGTFYRAARKRVSGIDVYIALCLMLFSSSWFYDGYIYWRDGIYPATWLSNLIISPTLYIAGGMFWNLDYVRGHGIQFAFQRQEWFHVSPNSAFRKILWVALPFMAFATYSMVWFVWDFLYR